MTLVAGLVFAIVEALSIVALSIAAACAPDEEDVCGGYFWDLNDYR